MREIRFRGKHKYGGREHGCLYVGRVVDRDITKDRDLARLALEAHKEDVIPDETHDFSATVVGLASMALHYISRTEHLERMLEAAIDLIAKAAPCPMPIGHDCARDVSFCEECVRDYLDQRAKEGEKHG